MDVCDENFNSILPRILADIKNSSFIAIDTEFTGLETNENFRRSYFDSGTSLYEKQCKNFEDVSICQVGISIFKSVIDNNAYQASTYNVYIRPHALLCVDENILCQVSSLEFLKEYKFDFKKWLIDGIPCLNGSQETKVRKFYARILSGEAGIRVPYEVINKMEIVNEWLKKSEIGSSMDIGLSNDTHILLFFASVLSSGINVLPVYENDQLLVTITKTLDEKMVLAEAQKALDSILDRLKGFVKVFYAMVDAKVPLILHNGIIDIILLYKQFHGTLPRSYQEFKSTVHSLFPVVYDTKQLAFILCLNIRDKKEHKAFANMNDNFLRGTSLKRVKADLQSEQAALHRPDLRHSPSTPKYSGTDDFSHEAGYDAFCTAYCFVHLSHIYAMMQYDKVECQRPLSCRELLHAMRAWVNEIPVQMAGIKYVALGGRNPEVSKRTWLVVESRNPLRPLTPEVVAATLTPFGTVDIVRRSRRAFMIASPRHAVTDDIMRTLGDNQHISISRYKAFKHSRIIRPVAWSCALLSTGLTTWFLLKTLK